MSDNSKHGHLSLKVRLTFGFGSLMLYHYIYIQEITLSSITQTQGVCSNFKYYTNLPNGYMHQ